MKLVYLFSLFFLILFISCEDSDKFNEPVTYEKMMGTWYLVDRGPNLDSTITACEKREYLIFRADSTAMRHQDCLPKSESEGVWRVANGKCMMKMDIIFNGVQVSTVNEEIEFELNESNEIKVQKKYPLFIAWGIYKKIEE